MKRLVPGNLFELESLEPRILLSADSFLSALPTGMPDADFVGIDVTIHLPAGWSMISLPVIPEDASVSNLFPDAMVVYGYEMGSGYVRKQTLEVGKGYWILMNEAQSYTLTGQPIPGYTLSTNQDGWLMIGGCTEPARASVDTGNIGVIYKYTQGLGYQRVRTSDNLVSGQGYWILIQDIVDQATLTV